jgi:hypothetical protein
MKSALILALLALTGCQTCREHPATCAIVTGLVASAIYISAQGTDHPPSAHDIQTPQVNCVNPESCK